MKPFIKGLFLSLSALLIFVSVAVAHGTGQSFKNEVGEYATEFEYDEIEVFAGEPSSFSFRLLNKEDGAGVPFDSVIVRFEKSGERKSILTARLVQDDLITGLARLVATFEEGDYLVYLIFYKEGEKLLSTEYPFNVLKGESDKSLPLKIAGLLLLGAGLGFGLTRVFSKSKKSTS